MCQMCDDDAKYGHLGGDEAMTDMTPEEQEVLKLAEEYDAFCESFEGGWYEFTKAELLSFAAKLRAKDAETVEGLRAAARFWNDRANDQAEEIASLKAQLAEAKKVPDGFANAVNLSHNIIEFGAGRISDHGAMMMARVITEVDGMRNAMLAAAPQPPRSE